MLNREIKFRGKSSHDNKWKFGWLIPRCMLEDPNYLNENWIATGNEDECDPVINESVGQFTGLKDVNGKDIYEGDIVRGMFEIQVGSRVEGRGQNKHSYAIREKKEVVGVITFEEKLSSFYFNTDFKQVYQSHFWAGMGSTKAEKIANEWTEYYDSPKNLLHKVITKIEVIGNTTDNPELLKN